MEIKKIYKNKNIETEPLNRNVFVHGAMHYKCEDCGKIFTMWLEKGLEDKMQDSENPELHKPVPFTIGCLCGGMASHVMWNNDIHLDGYRPLGEQMSYFENSSESKCGIPHIRKDANIENISNVEIIQPCEQGIANQTRYENPLEMFSTTQLKAELRHRKHN